MPPVAQCGAQLFTVTNLFLPHTGLEESTAVPLLPVRKPRYRKVTSGGGPCDDSRQTFGSTLQGRRVSAVSIAAPSAWGPRWLREQGEHDPGSNGGQKGRRGPGADGRSQPSLGTLQVTCAMASRPLASRQEVGSPQCLAPLRCLSALACFGSQRNESEATQPAILLVTVANLS